MLEFIGKGKSHNCNGTVRRDFLQIGALGAIGLTLPHLMAAEAAARMTNEDPHDDRSAIMIFNLGAPSNIDLWDMKPDAPREIRGPFKPISTNNDTFQVSESCRSMQKSPTSFRWFDPVTTWVPRFTMPVGKSCKQDESFRVASKLRMPNPLFNHKLECST